MDLEYDLQRVDEILILDIKKRVDSIFKSIEYYIKNEKEKYVIPEVTIEILKIDNESLNSCRTTTSSGIVDNLQKKIKFLIKYSES